VIGTRDGEAVNFGSVEGCASALVSDVGDAVDSGVAVVVVVVDGEKKCEAALIWRVCLVLWLAVRRRLAVQRDDDDASLAPTLEMEVVSERVSLMLSMLENKRDDGSNAAQRRRRGRRRGMGKLGWVK
jgi:hypothetical protein